MFGISESGCSNEGLIFLCHGPGIKMKSADNGTKGALK